MLPPSVTTREMSFVFMEKVPDPHSGDWNPCLEPPSAVHPHPLAFQRALSCIAVDSGLYVVANVGTLQPCDRSNDSACPDDGRYQFNTNVAYDPTGRLVARYRKYNLFIEEFHIYDRPSSPELVYFETPFGRVGTFTCFDVIFGEPAMSLVERGNVSHVAFPTDWTNVLPHYAAGPFHQSYAAAAGVNLLAANLHEPSKDVCGSGVYGWDGIPRAFRCTDDTSSALIVADVLARPDKAEANRPHLPTDVDGGVPDFIEPVFKDPFNLVHLRSNTGTISVCHNGLCCWLNYTRPQGGNDRFVLGAFRGLHTFEGQYYVEICQLMTCLDSGETRCGEGATTSSTHFSFIHLTGNFRTRYVYPQIVTTDVQPTTDAWEFERGVGTLVLPRPSTTPLLSAALYARRFDLDDGSVRSCSKDVGRTEHRVSQLFLAVVARQCPCPTQC